MADSFKQLVNFPKYEISETGNIVRNFKTKAIISIDKGGKTYRLFNEKGDRVSISKEKLKEEPLVNDAPQVCEPTEETAPATSKVDEAIQKAQNTTKEVKAKVKEKPVKEKGENRSEIIKKHWEEGKTKKEIVELTGYKPNTVYIVFNRLENAKKSEK